MERLIRYFTEGIEDKPIASSVGMEVETSFVHWNGQPMTVSESQELLERFRRVNGWEVTKRKGNLVTEVSDGANKLCYELGRQNIEIATTPDISGSVAISGAQRLVNSLEFSACPPLCSDCLWNKGPIVYTDEDLLIIPDERDTIWLELDGRPALELLARTSAVQFTISVPLSSAVECLNKLGEKIGSFIKDYPQEEYWRRYIKESKANYHAMRYGGPLFFKNIEEYCTQLAKHGVVIGTKLIPLDQVTDLDIPLYLRSIWWYFRLRRYGNTLCIEVRPLPRRSSCKFQEQFDFVMDTLSII